MVELTAEAPNLRASHAPAWAISGTQHGVVARSQLLELGLHPQAIKHRIASGRLHRTPWRGVYAVGRPELTLHGRWMAAILSCGPHAILSHGSAAELWEITRGGGTTIELSVPGGVVRSRTGITAHRRATLKAHEVTVCCGIPVTTPTGTLLDLAARLGHGRRLEAMIDAADKRGLTDPEALRLDLDRLAGRRGIVALRRTLDRHTFTLTDSELERRFLPLARRAGLTPPVTQEVVNGYRVDFYWPDLGLVVETDGLRYHRTPAQQARDRRRDQAHTAAGLTPLRFTRAQVVFDSKRVEATLRAVAQRLGGHI